MTLRRGIQVFAALFLLAAAGCGDLPPNTQVVPTPAAATHLAWSPDGRFVAAALADQSYAVWEAGSGRLVRELRGPYRGGEGVGVAFAPDGRHVIVEQTDKRLAPNGYLSVLAAWNIDDGTVADINAPSPPRAFAVSPATGRLFGLFERGEVIGFDTRTWLPAHIWKADPGALRGLAVQPGGGRLALAGVMPCARGLPPARVWIYDAQGGPLNGMGLATPLVTIDNVHHDGVSIRVAWAGNDRLVTTASQLAGTGPQCDGRPGPLTDADALVLWDAAQGIKAGTLPVTLSALESLAVSADGRLVALASRGEETDAPAALRIWDTGTSQLVLTWSGGGNSYRAVSFSPDGTFVAVSRSRAATWRSFFKASEEILIVPVP